MVYFAVSHNIQDASGNNKSNVSAKTGQENKMSAIITEQEIKVSASKIEQTEKQVNELNIVFTVNSNASLKHMFKTIDELKNSNSVDTIVKGEISSIEYVYLDHVAYSILTIDVIKSYKGNPAKTIKVYEDGGYVKLKDMLDDLKPHIEDNSLTAEQIENGVVDSKFLNAPHSMLGQQVIVFLTRNNEPIRPDSYRITSSVYGKFTLDKTDGQYKRLPLDPKEYSATYIANFEASIPEAQMENKISIE